MRKNKSPSISGEDRGRKKRRRRKGSKSTGRARGKVKELKILAALIAVCLAAAFVVSIFMRADLLSVANFVLFGTTDPYISPDREKEIGKEMKDIIQKEFSGQ